LFQTEIESLGNIPLLQLNGQAHASTKPLFNGTSQISSLLETPRLPDEELLYSGAPE